MPPLRVVTWNLWWRFGDWRARRKVAIDTLTETGPDICGLQEVWVDSEANFARRLAEGLRLHGTFVPAPDQEYWQARAAGPGVLHGIAILSRWPIRDVQAHALSHRDGRVAVSAVIRTPHGRLPFATVHLSSRVDAYGRRRQLETVLEAVGRSAETSELPPIVTGDFNTRPDSAVFDGLGDRFVDCWQASHGDRPGPTWMHTDPDGVRDEARRARIDYILLGRRPGRIYELRPESARVLPMPPTRSAVHSDHAALVADIEVRPSAG